MATSHSGIVKEAPKHSWDLLALRKTCRSKIPLKERVANRNNKETEQNRKLLQKIQFHTKKQTRTGKTRERCDLLFLWLWN